MIAVQVQTPTFFFERAIDRLARRFPAEAIERLKANLQAFRVWVAEPAFREGSPQDAVQHVLNAVGPAVQLKAGFLATLASVPDGIELFLQAVTEGDGDMVAGDGTPESADAADLLQRAQRLWVRFFYFHPDVAAVERAVGSDRLGEVLTLGFHADNLLTVCLMATDGASAAPSPRVIEALCTAARDFAQKYHHGVRSVVESVAPQIDTEAPLEPTTVADLLSLPPYDGPAATLEEMEAAIGASFGVQARSGSARSCTSRPLGP